jgi:hypothetical protein
MGRLARKLHEVGIVADWEGRLGVALDTLLKSQQSTRLDGDATDERIQHEIAASANGDAQSAFKAVERSTIFCRASPFLLRLIKILTLRFEMLHELNRAVVQKVVQSQHTQQLGQIVHRLHHGESLATDSLEPSQHARLQMAQQMWLISWYELTGDDVQDTVLDHLGLHRHLAG